MLDDMLNRDRSVEESNKDAVNQEEGTDKSNPVYRESKRNENDGLEMLEDEGPILKKLFSAD